jgi:serine protease Do
VQANAKDAGANYAVPIDLLPTGTPATARIHATEMLRSLMPLVSGAEPLKAETPLPVSFDEFSEQLKQLRLEYFDRAIGPLLEATRDNFILTGAGAAETCNFLNGKYCQCKGRAGVKGRLVANNPRVDEQLSQIEKGKDVAAVLAGVTIIRTTEGNAAPTHRSDLSRDSLLHLSLALKGRMAPSQWSSNPVSRRTTDRGEVYSDFHDRTWYLRSWPLEHRDFVMISLARSVPDGYVVLTRTVPTALGTAALMQVKFVANIIYYGCEELPSKGVAQVAQRWP